MYDTVIPFGSYTDPIPVSVAFDVDDTKGSIEEVKVWFQEYTGVDPSQ